MTPQSVDELFILLRREAAARHPPRSAKLATLLAESRTCLQLAAGFLGAVRGLTSPPAGVRFDVPDRRGGAIPVTMPAESAKAMIRHAEALSKAVAKLAKPRAS